MIESPRGMIRRLGSAVASGVMSARSTITKEMVPRSVEYAMENVSNRSIEEVSYDVIRQVLVEEGI